jgi:hypothetical protein
MMTSHFRDETASEWKSPLAVEILAGRAYGKILEFKDR